MIQESRSVDVATVQMNDPEQRNAFSIAMRLALLQTFRRLESNASVGAIVYTGRPRVFCVGGDVRAMGTQAMGPALERMRIVYDLVRLLAQSSKPILAAIEGWAVGGGLSLALLCDTVVAGNAARCKAGFGEIGMIGDTGICIRCRRVWERVGPSRRGVIDVVVPVG